MIGSKLWVWTEKGRECQYLNSKYTKYIIIMYNTKDINVVISCTT